MFFGVDKGRITSGDSEAAAVPVGGFVRGKHSSFLALLANTSQGDERATEDKGETQESNEGDEELIYGTVRTMVVMGIGVRVGVGVGVGVAATVDEKHGRHIMI